MPAAPSRNEARRAAERAQRESRVDDRRDAGREAGSAEPEPRPAPIVALGPEHAGAVRALHGVGLAECPSLFGDDAGGLLPGTAADPSLAPDPAGATFGVFDRHWLIGIVSIASAPALGSARSAVVTRLYVAPRARRRGLGSALVRRAVEFAAGSLKARSGHLMVGAQNLAAVTMCRQIGFTATGARRDATETDGVLHDELLMVCRVRQPS